VWGNAAGGKGGQVQIWSKQTGAWHPVSLQSYAVLHLTEVNAIFPPSMRPLIVSELGLMIGIGPAFEVASAMERGEPAIKNAVTNIGTNNAGLKQALISIFSEWSVSYCGF